MDNKESKIQKQYIAKLQASAKILEDNFAWQELRKNLSQDIESFKMTSIMGKTLDDREQARMNFKAYVKVIAEIDKWSSYEIENNVA